MDPKNEPQLTIITVCYNAEKSVAKTIESVLTQDYKNIEYLIIDGKSTDKTLEIINQYKDKISKIICEPDKGIYDAMNKGISNSTGDFLFFLNADDQFAGSHILSKIAEYNTRFKNIDIYSGKVKYIGSVDKPILNIHRNHFAYQSKRELITNPLPQQCIFASRKTFEIIGNFNLKYTLCADYEWLLRAYNHSQIKFKCVPDVFAYMDCGGSTHQNPRRILKESMLAIYKNSSFIDFTYYFFNFCIQRIKKAIYGREAYYQKLNQSRINSYPYDTQQ